MLFGAADNVTLKRLRDTQEAGHHPGGWLNDRTIRPRLLLDVETPQGSGDGEEERLFGDVNSRACSSAITNISISKQESDGGC